MISLTEDALLLLLREREEMEELMRNFTYLSLFSISTFLLKSP